MKSDPRFLDLYEREFAAVYRTTFLLCRDNDLAEEATQEAFARAFERWDRLAEAPWAGGWVTSTAVNVARRLLRRRRAAPPSDAETPDVDMGLDIWRAVATLPVRQQQAVVLTYRLGFDTRATAHAMGCGEPAVRAYLTRARRTLAERLRDEHDATR